MAESTDTASSPSIDDGIGWLEDQTIAALKRLQSIKATDTAPVRGDDAFFHPIKRNFQQDVVQCLYSAIDSLRFLAWSMKTHDAPFPYAQASLIRTAINGGSTALWMVSGSTEERRARALEFKYNDLRSHRKWLNLLAAEPVNQARPSDEMAKVAGMQATFDQRIDWILQEATTLLAPPAPFSNKKYTEQLATESSIVQFAGSLVTGLDAGEGWNTGQLLLQTWQLLSGYSHARPWASAYGSKHVIVDDVPDSKTGTIQVTVEGNPDRLLDYAFRALRVVEAAIGGFEQVCNT
ncbi:hypothetical protein BVC93_19520 [Mycobacterium sp. MS1601]|uniref:hypothetical protein n=1 Tax=Mycobacterium sp. MS1601 TaxID=1936029 RepID=UPI00097939ED|nr:hypothetical protein [Mycobacterium sp. MS1601]AQA04255.1 hypothetical protein BVC93_19520 [Mycobacterium sp. MS1601]